MWIHRVVRCPQRLPGPCRVPPGQMVLWEPVSPARPATYGIMQTTSRGWDTTSLRQTISTKTTMSRLQEQGERAKVTFIRRARFPAIEAWSTTTTMPTALLSKNMWHWAYVTRGSWPPILWMAILPCLKWVRIQRTRLATSKNSM